MPAAPSMPSAAGAAEPRGRRWSVVHWRLRSRLLLAVFLVTLTTLGVAGFGVQRMSVLNDKAEQVYTEGAVPLDGFRQLQALWWQFAAHTARARVGTLPPERRAQAQRDAEADIALITAQLAAVEEMALGAEARAGLEALSAGVGRYVQALEQLVGLVAAGNPDPVVAGGLLQTLDAEEAAIVEMLISGTAAAAEAAEARSAESAAAYTSARTLTVVGVSIGVLVAVVLALSIVRTVTGPVERLRSVLVRVAGGDLSVRVGAAGGGEIGEVGRSLDDTLEALSGVLRLVRTSATGLAASSAAMAGTATAMNGNAEAAARQAETIFSSAGEVAMSVDTVAAGSSEMEGAIREIASNANQAATVARRAVDVAGATTTTVGALGESSEQIAQVVKVITAIAEQTNLLALNATIEAARAGEMGKGFAVVATEVKELAQETARATEDIAGRVATIQSDTARAVAAIDEISAVIGEINDYQASIAAAVEQQTATTNEMNRNVAEAAGGSRSIADSVSGLAANAQQTHVQVASAQAGADELARMGADLEQAVAGFVL
ncbi:HAMP domain-containing protein [Modestobacter sp. I12A-02628]|uniref:Methyl-accepting chemotaxis protein n=1 Tax=Goekera deserti TaxID=2497753 RepID=A0A7K3WF66_9ACTN|nr:methyl-accepting chemotaxis protein [Goekera deserti]MPQ97835.1 HAMP domain-containing protein [Goekera deserti]NDI48480.1 HAMP domain-containing protein [Goekera deserti]NEL55141.1 methyl-accepting chemotaxis protein [Goekera deserti]